MNVADYSMSIHSKPIFDEGSKILDLNLEDLNRMVSVCGHFYTVQSRSASDPRWLVSLETETSCTPFITDLSESFANVV